ncbi:hypothetical protein LTR78_008064 [Recurvomyces mirabilis]|uniref:Rad51-like C-terminal domain-containing protein n=1 Tax=Recurvomyces mirabilis TaxID=574656 RepID=A0AAE0TTN8_9PEZI|nr:hypothetical protein LTR78_008064 [Recurvomyces mirabilis]KAK5150792.1 hypothetical protein LTS14_009855 [Recurvomyces mirabilis]
MAALPEVIDLSTQANVPPSSHRLPTVSASEALQELQNNRSGPLKTGLPLLDSYISSSGGIERGKTTELWGPAGAGKTAFGLNAAARELLSGHKVTWIDAATPLDHDRLHGILDHLRQAEHADSTSCASKEDYKNDFRSFTNSTLSHFLALILHTSQTLTPDGISLIVIDGINTLLDIDYPRTLFASSNRTEQQKWQAGRRYAILGTIISALNKLAVINSIAVVVTTGCGSRMRTDSGLGSSLVPGLGGAEWDGRVWNRMVVFRDFGSRFIGLQRCQGRSLISREEIGEVGKLFPFDIDHNGLLQQSASASITDGLEAKIISSPIKPRKRTFDEVADSEGEDVDEYGWADIDDDAVAVQGAVGNTPDGAAEDGAQQDTNTTND